jgi:hypothetical protein
MKMATREHGLFRRLDTPAPDAALGGCYVTHGTGPCVDTGVLIEFEGTLTLSVHTIRELAEVAGFSVDAEAVQNEQDIAHLTKRVAELEVENTGLRSDLDAVGRAIARSDQ